MPDPNSVDITLEGSSSPGGLKIFGNKLTGEVVADQDPETGNYSDVIIEIKYKVPATGYSTLTETFNDVMGTQSDPLENYEATITLSHDMIGIYNWNYDDSMGSTNISVSEDTENQITFGATDWYDPLTIRVYYMYKN